VLRRLLVLAAVREKVLRSRRTRRSEAALLRERTAPPGPPSSASGTARSPGSGGRHAPCGASRADPCSECTRRLAPSFPDWSACPSGCPARTRRAPAPWQSSCPTPSHPRYRFRVTPIVPRSRGWRSARAPYMRPCELRTATGSHECLHVSGADPCEAPHLDTGEPPLVTPLPNRRLTAREHACRLGHGQELILVRRREPRPGRPPRRCSPHDPRRRPSRTRVRTALSYRMVSVNKHLADVRRTPLSCAQSSPSAVARLFGSPRYRASPQIARPRLT
jgi:hypothetical protein